MYISTIFYKGTTSASQGPRRRFCPSSPPFLSPQSNLRRSEMRMRDTNTPSEFVSGRNFSKQDEVRRGTIPGPRGFLHKPNTDRHQSSHGSPLRRPLRSCSQFLVAISECQRSQQHLQAPLVKDSGTSLECPSAASGALSRPNAKVPSVPLAAAVGIENYGPSLRREQLQLRCS